MVPPPSGSVSASLRSAFLFSFSSSAAAGARVPTDSSSSSLLCLLPLGRPRAPSRTKTQTLQSQRGSHFRRPAPSSPPRLCTSRTTPLRHFRRRQFDRSIRSPALAKPSSQLERARGGAGLVTWPAMPPPPPPGRARPRPRWRHCYLGGGFRLPAGGGAGAGAGGGGANSFAAPLSGGLEGGCVCCPLPMWGGGLRL